MMSYLHAPTMKDHWALQREVQKLKGDLAHDKELLDAAQDKLAKVTEFHATHKPRWRADRHGDEHLIEVCDGCDEEWPCDTYKLLTKEG